MDVGGNKMNKFQEITKVVKDFQAEADRHFRKYTEEMQRAKERYSDTVYSQKSMEIWARHAGTLDVIRNSALNTIDIINDEILVDFRKWMVKPVNGDLLQTLNSIRIYEIKLTFDELEVLKSELQDSFFGLRILGEVAKSSGYFFDVPQMGDFTRKLHTAASNARDAIQCYSGSAPEFPGKDLLGEWTVSGISQGEYPVWRRLGAANYLEKDTSAKEAEEAWRASKIPLEFKVTEAEKERIFKMIENPASEEEQKERIRKLLEAEPDIRNKMELLGYNYTEMIRRYVDTGSFKEDTP